MVNDTNSLYEFLLCVCVKMFSIKNMYILRIFHYVSISKQYLEIDYKSLWIFPRLTCVSVNNTDLMLQWFISDLSIAEFCFHFMNKHTKIFTRMKCKQLSDNMVTHHWWAADINGNYVSIKLKINVI